MTYWEVLEGHAYADGHGILTSSTGAAATGNVPHPEQVHSLIITVLHTAAATLLSALSLAVRHCDLLLVLLVLSSTRTSWQQC
jgi:hypothetical protein